MDTLALEEISQAIKDLVSDIRAEAVAADLIESGVDPEDIQIKQQGAFFRPIRRDIVSTEVKNYDGFTRTLELLLSRNGTYDSLPEGLFHQPQEEIARKKSVKMLTDDYKLRKKQEKEARGFFQPIENEFFRQRVNLELAERQLLNKFRHVFNDFLLSFWKIDNTLVRKYTLRFIQLLPFANRMAGDFEQVCSGLAYTLNEKVTYELSYEMGQTDRVNILGNTKLGHSTIVGSATEAHPVVTFTIGPVKNGNQQDFLPGGSVLRFCETFYGYFIPLHVQANTEVTLDSTYRPDAESVGVLQYAFQL